MKCLFVASLLFLGATSAFAFSPEVTEITRPYEIVTIDQQAIQTVDYLGELTGFPITYEITSDEPFTLQAQVRQRYRSGSEPVGFSVIAIKQNERGGGVTEVDRVRPGPSDWSLIKPSQLGFSLLEAPALRAAVQPGTYRIEVSTPENIGKYMLSFGTQEIEDGYFASLGGVRTIQEFFDFSVFRLLASSYVYYPLGISIFLFILQRGWRYRKQITQNDT